MSTSVLVTGVLSAAIAAAQQATPTPEPKKPVVCADCHAGQVFRVNDLWRSGMDETEANDCTHLEQIIALRRSVSVVDDGLSRLSTMLTNLQNKGVEVKALRERWQEARDRFHELEKSEVKTDLDTMAESGKLSLALQKLYGSTESMRQERKARLVFSIIFLATLLVFLAMLSGLKMYLPEPIEPAQEIKEESGLGQTPPPEE